MKNAKKLLKALSAALYKTPQPNDPEPIKHNEVLARFLFQSSQFNTSKIKPAAFLPARNLETSVFRKSKLGKDYPNIKALIANERNKSIKAVALVNYSDIEALEILNVLPEESRHKWHANIVGWPQEKHEQKQLALLIANRSHKE